jgi:predicted short-subunit dehydrogenase-like oxidoreductase (DUF2520 family)
MDIKKMTMIGSGNVAWHFSKMFKSVGIEILEVHSRNQEDAKKLSKELNARHLDQLDQISDEADLIVLAVNDDSIELVSNQIRTDALVVHTSGTASIEKLSNGRKGVIWSIQSLRKNQETDYSKIPFLIESTTENDAAALEDLIKKISKQVFIKSSEERLKAHLGAVIANNFVNHLYSISQELLTEAKLPFSILLPIIEEETRKVHSFEPKEIQTGPAARGDQKTIESHLNIIQEPELKEIYRLISDRIKKLHHDL